MNSKLLIQNAYKYYDEKTDEYEDFISKIFKIKKKNTNSDLKNPIIILYDKDGKVICESNYEFVGTYKKKSKLWIWAWALPSVNKNETYISKKILKYGLDLSSNDLNVDSGLKEFLINSRLKIQNPIELEALLNIVLYISKKNYIISADDNLDKSKDSVLFFYLYNTKIF